MNLILIICTLGLVGLAGYMAHGWATSHALAVLVGDSWSIQAEGWAALWPPVSAGLLAGAVVGLALGVVLSGKLAEALAERQRSRSSADEAQKALQAQRLELARERAMLDAEIQKNVAESTASIKEWSEKKEIENEKLRREVLRLQQKERIIEGRLKGAQQKANRLKKAQLMRV